MGILFPPTLSATPAPGPRRCSSNHVAEPPAPCPADAASRTARLVDDFRAHAAEWQAAERAARPTPLPPAPRLTTAGACPGGTDAAFERWLRAAADTRPGH